jgi:hypothetical protein
VAVIRTVPTKPLLGVSVITPLLLTTAPTAAVYPVLAYNKAGVLFTLPEPKNVV